MTASSLVPTAELFGRLLLRELDAETLAGLREPVVADALAAVGVELPDEGELETLAAEYFELFIRPEHSAPPIGSLWVDGQYEGDTTVALRKIAAAAGCEFDPEAAAGAAVDHVGSVLMLWAACVASKPDLAQLVATQHMEWIPRALRAAGQAPTFYGALSRAAVELVESIRG